MYSSLLFLIGAASATAWDYPQGHSKSGKPLCDEAVVALATGIHINIIGQYAEFNGTKMVQEVEKTQPGNTTAFELAKGMLQSDIQGGMNIRLFNQEIAPPGNPAIPGLATYAAAQETEKGLAASLTGNPAIDTAITNTLLTDITNGIKLNEANLAAAVSQCEFYLKFPPADQMGS